LSTGATAQNIYKCGETYSQLPCPGGVLIDASDKRSDAQKRQADLATGRTARSADAMEKARLQQEGADIAANTPVPGAVDEMAIKPKTSLTKKKKKKAPDYFTAQTPGEKKKKNTAKKNAVKKVASPS
jgi:hypothetical protein